MKKLSKLFFFLTLLCTPSTVEGANLLPSTESLKALGQSVIAAKNITLQNTSPAQIAIYGGQFIVDVTTFGAVFYLQPSSILTIPLGGLAVFVSGQRIKESVISYWAWLK